MQLSVDVADEFPPELKIIENVEYCMKLKITQSSSVNESQVYQCTDLFEHLDMSNEVRVEQSDTQVRMKPLAVQKLFITMSNF